jgi:succinoglycan biosynthesis protein ExoM
MAAAAHISVCVCTFKREKLLKMLLRALDAQRTDGLFTYEVVVADNDAARSAESVVREFGSQSGLTVTYCVEPEPNIARARNAAVSAASGSFIAFIDDDELPGDDWLYLLLRTCGNQQVSGVLGPVMARFEHAPPAWIEKGKFFDRPRYPTGRPMDWPEARTGNVLFRRRILDDLDPAFRPEFATAGEDVDFFRRAMAKGARFVWCDEAVVFELVPPHRCTRRYLLRRALLRGSNFPKHPTHRVRNSLKSLVAVPCYALALPLLTVAGHHVFMAYLIKVADHGSRLLAFAGLPVVIERQN